MKHRGSASMALAAASLALLGACASNGNPKKPTKIEDAAVYNTQLGINYLHQGELAVAKEKLDRAVKQDPNYAPAHAARASLYDRLGQPAEAEEEFKTALRLAPNDPDMINNYAVYLCQHSRTDEGVKEFQAAAANPLYRTPAVAYTNAGVCLRAAKRDDEARQEFLKALQLSPNNSEALFQLANLEFQQKNYAQAHTLIDAYLGHFPETADILLLGVRIARAQGDQAASQKYARKLQQNFPGTDQTRALAALDHG